MSDPMESLIRTVVQPGQVAFDIGANSGTYTGVLEQCVGPRGKVVAVEPHPVVMGQLRNKSSAAVTTVFNFALSDKNETRTFFLDERPGLGAVASSLQVLDSLHQDKMVKPVSVRCVTLDWLCEQTGLVPNFIKIDVEGHELQVIQGAWGTIQKHQPIVVFEFWECWWDKSVRQIFEMLRPHYRLIRIQDGKDVESVYYSYQGSGVVDIACLPRSLVQ